MRKTLTTVVQSTRQLPLAVQFGGAFATVGAATVTQLSLTGITLGYPFFLFFAANALNGALWKRSAALTGVVLCTLAATMLIIRPQELSLEEIGDLLAIALFLAIGTCEVLVLGALVDGQSRLQAALLRAQRAEEEHELLFAETNHRIKNNLQIIGTFLTLQANHSSNPDVTRALKSAAARLNNTSHLHHELSRVNGEHVDLDSFMGSITDHLSSLSEARKIRLVCNSDCKLAVPSHVATTVGLLANELVTNAIKHAFPKKEGGQVLVRLSSNGERQMILSVEDDGIGMKRKKSGTGTKFIEGLTVQLKGRKSYGNGGNGRGTQVQIVFPIPSDEHPAAERQP